MHFNLYSTIFIFTYLISESKSDKWIDPSDMSPNYPNEWVDPHDIRPSKEYLKYTNNPSSLHKQQTNPGRTVASAASEQLVEIYYKRTINMLLKSVHEDTNEIDTYSGYLYFKINANDYERLKNFAESTDDDNDDTGKNLFEMNRILEEILTKPSHQHIQEFLESWFHKFLNVAFSRKGIITIILFSYIIVLYEMVRTKYNVRYILTFFIVNIFIYDFIFTWIHLYQKTEIEYMVNRMKYKDVPVECNPETMDSWQFLWNLMKIDDECQKFHQVTYQDIFWKVSPGAVLTDMFARSIEQPASSVGNAFANICASIYNKFPWPMNIIIFPVAMIFFCLMTMILLSVLFNRNLHFNFLHIFSFTNSAANHPRETNSDRLTDQNVERLLRIAENQQLQQLQQQQQQHENRVFIEEIQVKPEIKTIEKPVKEDYEKTVKEEEEEVRDETITSTSEETSKLRQRLVNASNTGAGDS